MNRPPIYLLVILPLLLFGAVVVYLAVTAYATFHEIPVSAVPRANGFLIALPTLFLWIPVALLLSNVVLNAVPPLRRVAEDFVARSSAPTYSESQQQLLKVLKWTAFACIPLVAIGWFA
jgi:hypothetical protein